MRGGALPVVILAVCFLAIAQIRINTQVLIEVKGSQERGGGKEEGVMEQCQASKVPWESERAFKREKSDSHLTHFPSHISAISFDLLSSPDFTIR